MRCDVPVAGAGEVVVTGELVEGAVVATVRFELRPADAACELFAREVARVVRVARRVGCVRADLARAVRARVDRVDDARAALVVFVATERGAAEGATVVRSDPLAILGSDSGSVASVDAVMESSAAIGDGVSVGCDRVSRLADITSRASVLSWARTSPTGFGSSEHAARDSVALKVQAILRRAVFIRGGPVMGSS